MKTEMVLRRVGNWLRADDFISWERFVKIPDDSEIVVTVRKSRHPEHLVKYWAILGDVVEFDPDYDYADDLDVWVRMSIPWMREEIQISDGRVVVKLKSIAIDQMDQTEFQRFYDQAIELLTLRIGRDPETIYTKEEQHARSVRVDQDGRWPRAQEIADDG